MIAGIVLWSKYTLEAVDYALLAMGVIAPGTAQLNVYYQIVIGNTTAFSVIAVVTALALIGRGYIESEHDYTGWPSENARVCFVVLCIASFIWWLCWLSLVGIAAATTILFVVVQLFKYYLEDSLKIQDSDYSTSRYIAALVSLFQTNTSTLPPAVVNATNIVKSYPEICPPGCVDLQQILLFDLTGCMCDPDLMRAMVNYLNACLDDLEWSLVGLVMMYLGFVSTLACCVNAFSRTRSERYMLLKIAEDDPLDN